MRKKLRVWWIPQVPMKAFYVNVETVKEGAKLLNVLANYDLFQFENKVKPDYSNTGGLQEFDPNDKEDGPNGSWVDWYDEDIGIEDPDEYVKHVEDSVVVKELKGL